MRTSEEQRIAERACQSEYAALEARHGCACIGQVTWTPITGMRANVKAVRLANGTPDNSEAGQRQAEAFLQEAYGLMETHGCLIMPHWSANQRTTDVGLAIIATEKAQPQIPQTEAEHEP